MRARRLARVRVDPAGQVDRDDRDVGRQSGELLGERRRDPAQPAASTDADADLEADVPQAQPASTRTGAGT